MDFTGKQLRRLFLKRVISASTYYALKSLHKKRRTTTYTRKEFFINNWTDEECESYFRFSKMEINQLVKLFRLPEKCVSTNKLSFSGLEAICVLLRRLCYPNRLLELVPMFSRDPSSLSRIYNWTLNFIYEDFGYIITKLENRWLTPQKLDEFVMACTEAGSALPNICGFIDGTARPICRPTRNQKEQYSGYKKSYCLKYQSTVFPNGIIGRLDGPFNGRRHDAAILHLSGLIGTLEKSLSETMES